jgi:hypothetical protein
MSPNTHCLLVIAALTAVLAPSTAFAPRAAQGRSHFGLQANAGAQDVVATAASSFEEDLLLTIQVIRDHEARSTTVSTKQFLQQVKAAGAVETPHDEVDIAVPYDSAALLAYEASLAAGDGTTFSDFKLRYVTETVDMVKAKKAAREAAQAPAPKVEDPKEAPKVEEVAAPQAEVVDISVPYDAAAMLAYEAAGSPAEFAAFKATYEADAVAMVTAKKAAVDAAKAPKKEAPKTEAPKQVVAEEVVDISVPYDAAAQLAYEAAGKPVDDFAAFKETYVLEAVAMVTAKKAAQQRPKSIAKE